MNNTELLQKQFAAISKAGNDVTLRSDNCACICFGCRFWTSNSSKIATLLC